MRTLFERHLPVFSTENIEALAPELIPDVVVETLPELTPESALELTPEVTPPALLTLEDIKTPEGFDIPVESKTQLIDLFNDDKLLPSDRANKLLELYAKEQANQVKAWVDRQEAAKTELTNDPVVGGKNLDATLVYAAKVFQEFGSEPLVKKIEASGLANDRDFAEFLVKIGKITSEGKAVVAAPTSDTGNKTLGQILYPEQGKT
jgi:hypothetical protein